jgi:hypothetical protein
MYFRRDDLKGFEDYGNSIYDVPPNPVFDPIDPIKVDPPIVETPPIIPMPITPVETKPAVQPIDPNAKPLQQRFRKPRQFMVGQQKSQDTRQEREPQEPLTNDENLIFGFPASTVYVAGGAVALLGFMYFAGKGK